MPGYTVPSGLSASIASQAIGAVQGKFYDAYQKINSSYEDTKEQFAALEDFLTGLTPMELFPDFEDPEFARYTLTTGELPIAPTVDFPTFTVPDLDTPIPGFNYSDSPYSSELREALKLKLKDGVEDGGSGLGADIEDALYARNQLRDEQAVADRLDAVSAEWAEAAGDLGLPDGALLAARQEIHAKYLENRQTTSKEITVKMAELARQQEEVYLKTGTELENVMEQKHSSDQTRSLEAAKIEPEIIIRTFEAAMTKVKVYAEIYNALAAKANAQAEIFKAQMMGYSTEAEIGSKELTASTQKYAADIEGAKAKSEASWRTDTNIIEQVKNYLMLRMEGMKSLAQLNSSILSAFATSVSATASVQAQGSGNASDYTNNSSSYQEINNISD
jgi:hypothetical protein